MITTSQLAHIICFARIAKAASRIRGLLSQFDHAWRLANQIEAAHDQADPTVRAERLASAKRKLVTGN